jgi:MFS family permease
VTSDAGSGRLDELRALARRRPFRRLIAAQTLSQFADGLYQIALASVLIFSVEAAQTPAQVTKILAVTYLPFSLVGPFTGPFIDRFSRRSVLVVSKALMVGITLAMIPAFRASELLLLGLAVANVSINRFFHAAKNAVLPTLVEERRYLVANAVSTTTGAILALLGGAVGGRLIEWFAPEVALVAAAVMMTVSSALAASLRLPRGEKRGLAGVVSELRENARDVADGLRVLGRSGQALYGVVSIWAMRALLGFMLLASLVLLRARFDIGAGDFADLLVTVGVGTFIGAVVVTPLAGRLGYRGVAPLAIAAASVAIVLGGTVASYYAVLPTVFVGGVAVGATKIAADTLVQRGIPDRFRGRAFMVYDLGFNGAFVLAGLIPTLLRPVMGDVGVMLLTAALAVAAAGALVAWRRRVPEPIEVRTYAGGRGDEVPREVVLEGTALAVDRVERSWHEDRAGERLRCFRLRLAGGRRIQVSRGDTWRLDRELARG